MGSPARTSRASRSCSRSSPRASWPPASDSAVGRIGKPLVGPYKKSFAEAKRGVDQFDAGLGLLCIARRHQRLEAELTKFFERQRGSAVSEISQEPGARPPSDPHGLSLLFRDVLDKLAEDSTVSAFGARRLASMWQGHEIAGRKVSGPDDVPPDVALAGALNTPGDPVGDSKSAIFTAMLAAEAARLPASAFYYPQEYLPYTRMDFSPEVVLDYLRHTEAPAPRREPVIREATPGRNDPCPCGSGAKFKRCCGA